jgi:3-oxoadipate enol-lactonase
MTKSPKDAGRQIAGGISYRASIAGDTDGLPVICLHGIGGDDTSFADQLDNLGARSVYAWNMPGYAGSAVMKSMDFAALSDALIGFMDALGIARAHLAGQSIGGMIAQETAIRYPGRIASLVLIATVPAFGGRDDSFKQAFLHARLAPLEAGGDMRDVANDAIPAITGPNCDAAMQASAIEAMAAIDQNAYRQVLATLVTFNRRDDQNLLTLPCCLIAGSLDDNAPARVMEKMANNLPNASFHIIDHAGHLVNTESPNQVNAIVTAFLDKTDHLLA